MSYELQPFKIPKESADYAECSRFVTVSIESIIKDAIAAGRNKIVINTNLKLGLPMENINKIAGPFVEAWAAQTFVEVVEDKNNKYQLINVEAVARLHMADVSHVETGNCFDIDQLILVVLVLNNLHKCLCGPRLDEGTSDLIDVLHREAELQIGVDHDLVSSSRNRILDD